jgi:hypothetical protein
VEIFIDFDNFCDIISKKDIQQSKKLAAINNSNAISGGIGKSGISVELFVYRTL